MLLSILDRTDLPDYRDARWDQQNGPRVGEVGLVVQAERPGLGQV